MDRSMTLTARSLAATLIAVAALGLGGCASTRLSSASAPPQQLTPIPNANVESENLPPIGADGQVTTADNGGQFITGDPGLDGQQTASTDGSFVSLNDVGTLPSSGRDLSGGVTIAKLLGTWTVSSNTDQCRLNLTQTAKAGTKRYRASTPGCTIQALAGVASWQLAGSQIQLYDESGSIIGSLLQSGNRFIGTLSGGVAVAMAG